MIPSLSKRNDDKLYLKKLIIKACYETPEVIQENILNGMRMAINQKKVNIQIEKKQENGYIGIPMVINGQKIKNQWKNGGKK